MLSRRAFLAALSCVPFVGKMIPQETVIPAPIECAVCRKVCPQGKQLLWTLVAIPDANLWLCPPHGLEFEAAARKADYDWQLAEWDRRYQA